MIYSIKSTPVVIKFNVELRLIYETCIIIHNRGDLSIMIIIVGNGIGNFVSKSWTMLFVFYSMLMPLEKAVIHH